MKQLSEILESEDLMNTLNEIANSSNEQTEFSNQEVKNNFYWSNDWRKLSKEIIKRDHNECIVCKSNGKVSLDKLIVHHIYPIEQYPMLRLNKNNLITVCLSCHNGIHYKNNKNKWDDEWW